MLTSFHRKTIASGVVICGVILLSSCGGEKQAEVQVEPTADSVVISMGTPVEETHDYGEWITYQYETFKIIYPEKHPHVSVIPDMAKAYMGALRADCRFLQLQVPTDTLTMYYYVGPGHGRAATGQMYPYFKGDTLYYWTPSAFGTPLMKYLIHKWQNIEPRHRFLWHGLIALLDNSGKNYHERTLDLIQTNDFIPLEQLAVDSTMSSDYERYQSAMAASLVDFLVFNYGLDKFAQLYRSQDDFGSAIKGTYGITTDSLQTLWLSTIENAVTQMNDQSNGQ